jgi:hypothetical protein
MQRLCQRGDHAALFVPIEIMPFRHVQHALDELLALGQERVPVLPVGAEYRLPLIQQPVGAFGQNVAKLPRTGAVGVRRLSTPSAPSRE